MLTTMIGAALLIGVLSLTAPVSVAFTLERSARVRATWRVRWLFGLVRITGTQGPGRRTPRSSVSRPSPDDGRPRRRSRGTQRRGGQAGRVLDLVRTPGLASRVLRFLSDLAHQVKIERGYVHGVFGFDDPADTGVLYGTLSPLLVAASAAGFDVLCRPDFQEAGLRGSCGGRLRMRPISVIWTCFRFLCSAPVLRSTRVLLKG